ncbi:hypothetical protein ACFWAT_20070 [Streptomyces syringium]|uniref:hypothetical protein n=1 Tax=Streptomyces syringium TaxID=76729 RepID=UPI00364F53A4
MDSRGNAHPGRARDAAGYVELMRRLKDRSGLTYRQIEEAAAESGEVLARSTLAGALARSALPRPELVAAFVRACGDGDRVQAWLQARDRIARQAEEPAPDGPDATRRPAALTSAAFAPAFMTRALRMPRLALWAVALALVAAATVWWIAAPDDRAGRPVAATRSATPTADDHPVGYSTFTAQTGGGGWGRVKYRYTPDGDGYYTIDVGSPQTHDYRINDRGIELRMHYERRGGGRGAVTIGYTPDSADTGRTGARVSAAGYKNVWFEVCGWLVDRRESVGCERLRKLS